MADQEADRFLVDQGHSFPDELEFREEIVAAIDEERRLVKALQDMVHRVERERHSWFLAYDEVRKEAAIAALRGAPSSRARNMPNWFALS